MLPLFDSFFCFFCFAQAKNCSNNGISLSQEVEHFVNLILLHRTRTLDGLSWQSIRFSTIPSTTRHFDLCPSLFL
ncbi:unnamed protein product [Citrullus colocynthis]|uniref:Secreted protein n=1 Tax=Citrullus colocynthis TaxID=252529 RepID=A0ABP0XWN0_9ROSI